jgi:hypothetical protein
MISNMTSVEMLRERYVLSEDTFAEIVIWQLTRPVRGSPHRYKYRLALVVAGTCVLRYDNEAGKGDHRHVDGRETPYVFGGYEKLLSDFWADVQSWRQRR